MLQKVLKEENVLIVKFVDEGKGKTSSSKGSRASFAAIEKVAQDGIYLGHKLYRFFGELPFPLALVYFITKH